GGDPGPEGRGAGGAGRGVLARTGGITAWAIRAFHDVSATTAVGPRRGRYRTRSVASQLHSAISGGGGTGSAPQTAPVRRRIVTAGTSDAGRLPPAPRAALQRPTP